LIRRKQPKVGCRKLQEMLKAREIEIGRDRLFNVLRNKNMLVKKKKKYVRTTQSYHRFRTYKNLIKQRQSQRPEEVFVSDITYIDTMEGYSYLSLITDQYSRKIVGYALSKSLSIEGSLKALKMALKQVSDTSRLIHHSDRGIQYCSKGYTELLIRNSVQISMTEDNHVYENALAERVNGILKDEFLLGEKLQSHKIAENLVRESIYTYNNERLHLALDYMTPEQKHAA
jgi:putative transposase